MTLPASQYSVLDAKRIDRIDEQTFRCYVDSIHFFNLVFEPVLTVSVNVGERGPTVKLLDTRVSLCICATANTFWPGGWAFNSWRSLKTARAFHTHHTSVRLRSGFSKLWCDSWRGLRQYSH